MVVKKLNKFKLFGVIIALLLIIGAITIFSLIKKHHNSIEYKLEEKGYSEIEVSYIKANFDISQISQILSIDYSKNLIALSKEKYFRFDKLKEYLEYYNKNKNLTETDIVTKVNTHTNIDFYDEIIATDTSKKELMMVNKYYKLSETYEPSDLVEVSSRYAYKGKYISESILESLKSMLESAMESGYVLVVTQGYRSYEDQLKAYENYKNSNGEASANAFVSKAGHSDYQTGLGLDIEPYNKTISNPNESEEHIWLMENSYKYGFILRYPEDKENITGFSYYPWRFRYVGVELSTYIYNNNITFEEYYGYKF